MTSLKPVSLALASALLAFGVASPDANAWTHTLSVGPSWRTDLAPQQAFMADQSGNVCLMTNDRVNGRVEFAHGYVFAANGSEAFPHQSIGGQPQGIRTLGMSCAGGAMVLAHQAQQQDFVTRSAASSPAPQIFPLPPMGAIHPAWLSLDAQGAWTAVRVRENGSPFALERHLPNQLGPGTFREIEEGYPSLISVDAVRVLADGRSVVIGASSRPRMPTAGLYVARFDANGMPIIPLVDDDSPDSLGDRVIAGNGSVFSVRHAPNGSPDSLRVLRMNTTYPGPAYVYGMLPAMIEKLHGLDDGGVLVVGRQSPWDWQWTVARVDASAMVLWNRQIPAPGPQATSLFEVAFQPATPLATSEEHVVMAMRDDGNSWSGPHLILAGFGASGAGSWLREVQDARFDHDNPIRLAATSDGRIALAVEVNVNGSKTIRIESIDAMTGNP